MQAEVRIERYADQGRCVAHIDGRVVFVRFALPDDSCESNLTSPTTGTTGSGPAKSSRFSSRPKTESPRMATCRSLGDGRGSGRRGSRARLFARPAQVEAITVSEQMSRLGHIDVAVPIERMPGDKAAGGLNWRTRIEMIADDNGMPSMRRRGTHNRVAIDTMPLATRTLLDVAKREHVWRAALNPAPRFVFPCPNRAARSSIPRQQTTITPYLWTANCAPAPSCSPNR